MLDIDKLFDAAFGSSLSFKIWIRLQQEFVMGSWLKLRGLLIFEVACFGRISAPGINISRVINGLRPRWNADRADDADTHGVEPPGKR